MNTPRLRITFAGAQSFEGTQNIIMKTYLDLVNECDVFPYPEKDPSAHSTLISSLYTLIHEDVATATQIPIGYISLPVLQELTKVPVIIKGEMGVNRSQRTVSIFTQATEAERTAAVAATCAYWRSRKTFQVLSGWRDELYPVYGSDNEVLWSIERSASVLFGIASYGIHMMAYVRCPDVSYGIKLWVPRRSATKSTYPSMLDNTVAGGMATGEDKFEALVRECMEEASLPEDVVRKNVKAHGALTYMYIRGATAGGETGLMQPECEYIYDLELSDDVIPKPNDSEVEQFYLWTVEEVQEHMKKGEFKTNCGIVLLDFFIRHGILTQENESHFDEIKSRIHRKLPFPGPHNS
ncbi:hypothetical protein DID88_003126 [Monilinia fructigena]|uniref:Nudix hydrolase domain-containing protein n=1 Tax=Monilinia fructigena TaxID=38457 RepID=A0A395IW57_9HELO|nr:hypothetical protein DID88_003126 [Monilinia fructigena]